MDGSGLKSVFTSVADLPCFGKGYYAFSKWDCGFKFGWEEKVLVAKVRATLILVGLSWGLCHG